MKNSKIPSLVFLTVGTLVLALLLQMAGREVPPAWLRLSGMGTPKNRAPTATRTGR